MVYLTFPSSGLLVLVTVATAQRRFGAGHMNQMFDRMQRAEQDSYGERRACDDGGINDSLIGAYSVQNKFSLGLSPDNDVWISAWAEKCLLKFSEMTEMIIS